MATTKNKIPEAFQITEELHQRTYLVNGELRKWDGDTSPVISTISSTEEYAPTTLGSVPDMGEAEALDALEAALAGAYLHGSAAECLTREDPSLILSASDLFRGIGLARHQLLMESEHSL